MCQTSVHVTIHISSVQDPSDCNILVCWSELRKASKINHQQRVLNIADMTLIASRLLRRFQKSPGCHACWAHGISQRACLQRGGEDKGDTGPVIDTCKNWNWYTMIYMWIMLSSPCILCKKWWSKKKISCRIRAGQNRFRLFVVAAHCQYASLGTMSSQIRWRQRVNG